MASGSHSFPRAGWPTIWPVGITGSVGRICNGETASISSCPTAAFCCELLNRIDNDELDRVVCTALLELQGRPPAAIAVDGKTVRNTRPAEKHENKLNLFAALAHGKAIVQNQVQIDDKSNEIAALAELLAPLELDGTVVTSDALNTQRESARHIVQNIGTRTYYETPNDPGPIF